jgi:hypothetical protein
MVATLRAFLLPDMPMAQLLPLILMGGTLLIGGLAIYWTARGRHRLRVALEATGTSLRQMAGSRDELTLAACWLTLPILIPFVLSLVLWPMYLTRYTVPAAPAFYLLTAYALWHLRRLVPPIAVLGVLALVITPGLRAYYRQPVNEQWREAAAHVAGAAQPGDATMLVWSRLGEGWFWYYRGNLPQCSAGEEFYEVDVFHLALEQCLAGAQRVWVVSRDTGTNADFNELLSRLRTRPGGEEHEFNQVRLYLITREAASDHR